MSCMGIKTGPWLMGVWEEDLGLLGGDAELSFWEWWLRGSGAHCCFLGGGAGADDGSERGRGKDSRWAGALSSMCHVVRSGVSGFELPCGLAPPSLTARAGGLMRRSVGGRMGGARGGPTAWPSRGHGVRRRVSMKL